MDEGCHLPVAIVTESAYQRPNVAIESSKLVPPRSPNRRVMMLKILIVHKQQELTVEERSLSTLFKLIGVGILLSFTVSLFNFLPWQKVFKK
jgi:hypothetical protein